MERVAAAEYRFGRFALVPGLFELRRDGQRVRIERLAFDFLVFLIRHRERVVAHAELLGELWPGTVVTRNALTRVAHLTRIALDDDAGRPLWIATLTRRGYRFVGAVCELAREGDSEPRTLLPYRHALELLDTGALAALRWELLMGVDEANRILGEPPDVPSAPAESSRLPAPAWLTERERHAIESRSASHLGGPRARRNGDRQRA